MAESLLEIYTKYPNLFPTNCIDCLSGWYKIIDQMCAAIQVYVDNEVFNEEIDPQFECIREKFGILDIQIKGSEKVVNLIVKSCERLSYHTCEYCGEPGELYVSSKHRSWSHTKTLCLDHAIELYYYMLYKKKT